MAPRLLSIIQVNEKKIIMHYIFDNQKCLRPFFKFKKPTSLNIR